MTHFYILISHYGIVPEIAGPYQNEEDRDKAMNSTEHRKIMNYTKLDLVDGKPKIKS